MYEHGVTLSQMAGIVFLSMSAASLLFITVVAFALGDNLGWGFFFGLLTLIVTHIGNDHYRVVCRKLGLIE